MGKAEEVLLRLVHSPDPRLRSFIINWLNPLGADPHDRRRRGRAKCSERLPGLPPWARGHPKGRRPSSDRRSPIRHAATAAHRRHPLRPRLLDPARPDPGRGNLRRREVLVERSEPLVATLLDLYHNDPDAGIHGAAEWTLRQWKQDKRLKNAQAELRKLLDKGPRRWFVNSQGQTFAVINGPVEFRMGSLPGEPERDAYETPHLSLIPRRFAIADKEVTVEQYQRFAKENSQFGIAQNFLDRYSPDLNGPMIAVSWFGAAAYCNWLSKQEGFPENQWCYLPNEQREYDAGMTIPADALKRTGYRLPAEAEWEYACRAARSPAGIMACQSACSRLMPGTRPAAKHMPGPQGACYPTTWACSTCLGTCMNGVRSVRRTISQELLNRNMLI